MSFKTLKLADKKTKTEVIEMSWGAIEDKIAEWLHITKAISPDREVLTIKLNYQGGYVSKDKIIPVEIITKKGVKYINLDVRGTKGMAKE